MRTNWRGVCALAVQLESVVIWLVALCVVCHLEGGTDIQTLWSLTYKWPG